MNDKIQEFIGDATEYGCYSDCCGAEIIMGDICMDCREHCEPIEEGEDE